MTFKQMIVTSCAAALLQIPCFAQDAQSGPLPRWGSANKPEPGLIDPVARIKKDVADLKARVRQLEENHTSYSASTKNQLVTLEESLNALQAQCDKWTTDGSKSPVVQTSAIVPVAKVPVDDSVQRRLDEIASMLRDLNQLPSQVQTTTREVTDLKKKYDTLQIELIQAQNDIGKLQQDLARHNAASSDSTRRSLALPLPPDSANTNTVTPRPALGTVKLVNTYPATLNVIVDGQYYTLRSNESLSLNKNPGYFTYEVPGIQPNTLRTLNAAETLTIQIYPR
ncbi:MAG: hypothetical protein JNJ77_11260 [Planctomycetia bacterium]|nr:hypothetical protein [Planctomycetia bacterium]